MRAGRPFKRAAQPAADAATLADPAAAPTDAMAETPRLELLETRWRLLDPQQRELTCGIYLSDTGYDVRSHDAGDALVRTQWARDIDAARRIADGWLRDLRDDVRVKQLPIAGNK